jgi:hypothetical protein
MEATTMATTADFRLPCGTLRAERAANGSPFGPPKPSGIAAKLGLRYERNINRELTRHVMPGRFAKVEHNPWFTFYDDYGPGNCSPDFLLWTDSGSVIIVEVKLTWVEVAIAKLTELYRPVVCAALGAPTFPLIICRNVTPASPPAAHTLTDALASPFCLLQWPSNGHILWS